RSNEWGVGISLDVPAYGLDRRELRAGLIGAETGVKKAALNLRKFSDNLELECIDSVRQIRTLEKQIALAAKARELSERKLAVEQEKLKAGRSTNFQIVSYQDDLRNAKISELSARISYLDALSDLDVFMGTMTLTWGIDLNDRAPAEGPRSASEPASLRAAKPEDLIATAADGVGNTASVTLLFTEAPGSLPDIASGPDLPPVDATPIEDISIDIDTASGTEVSR
ncbi:TolC family protein, partial [Candidatus Ozemobacteraceae bacterium]|nr:TolC family protein [Candidatus Ozemobacteraceae bacterium]